MLPRFRTILRSLCLNDESGLTTQMSAQRSNAWVRSQNGLRYFWRQFPTPGVGGRALDAACLPIGLAHRDKPHQPKSFSLASAFAPAATRPAWRHCGLAPRRRGRLLPAPSPKYRPKYGVCGHLSASPHRSHAAPFFAGLDRLTIQDSCAGLRMTACGFAHLAAHTVVNMLPGSVQSPVAKIGVDRLP
jgi:hypothetical protein